MLRGQNDWIMELQERQEFRQPAIFRSFSGLVAAESTRLGGFSNGPYASLNLGLNTGDDDALVQANRAFFFNALGWTTEQVASAYQVHGDSILQVDTPCREEGFDALITDVPGIFLTVTVADCTPILVLDPVRPAVAAIHAGWRGTVLGILKKTILRMQEVFGTNPQDCRAFIGACIDACSYEVDADVAQHFSAPYAQWSPELQKYLLDLKSANQAQLLEVGLLEEHIEISPYSTVLNNDLFFSYRKEKGITGRMLNGIGLI
jgi:YfiH family protein